MADKNSATLEALLRFALPLGTSFVTGNPQLSVDWAVTVRARPPAFTTIYGGELALVSMGILSGYDTRITLSEVIESLADVGVGAIAIEGDLSTAAVALANAREVSLLHLPEGHTLSGVERAVNRYLLNQTAQLTERALEVQRQLAGLVAENRDLNSLLNVIARATAKPVLVHDDAGVLMAQVFPTMNRRNTPGRQLIQGLPYGTFQQWLQDDAPNGQGTLYKSPIGHTSVLKVEKRVAGYLSLVDTAEVAEDFDRLVLLYGADVCAIELAKNRAIASAVEQARGDWVQMWLSGTPSDDELLTSRAQQAGFDPQAHYLVAVFRPLLENGQALPMESLISLVRDDMTRRQLNGAVGQYVDVIVALYPLDASGGNSQSQAQSAERVRGQINDLRKQLAMRTPSGLVSAGISRPTQGLTFLRDSYREARDAVRIAHELGEDENTTFYGDLKLYQLLLALKENNLAHMRGFYDETLGPLIEHDNRKQSDLVRTLNGFFAANGNLAKAAQDLDVHRNTLVYRLDRISELTNLDLNDADNRLILHLALKIQRVLATLPSGEAQTYRVTR